VKPLSLSKAPLFAILPPAELAHLAATLEQRDLPAQSILLQEGCADDHFYALLEGEVEIIKALGTGDERMLGVRAATCLLGEMSLFSEDGCHTASVRALTPISVVQMTRTQLDALLQRQPALAYDLVRLLTRRLQESENATILDLREKNRQLTDAYQELQAAQAQIVEKEKLEHELQIARDMQFSVLPQTLPEAAGFDLGALIVPARAVGGDFYDVMELGDQRLGIAVGDVCDKGVPAALFMMRTYSLLRAAAGPHRSPEQVLREVNRHLLSRNPSGMFVTLLYGILDCPSGRLSYARAGHPTPIVLDRRPQMAAPIRSGQPLGLLEKPAIDVQDVLLPEGAMVLGFSDGLSDAMADQGETALQDLCAALASKPGASAQSVVAELFQEVVARTNAQQQRDDFVAVAVKRKVM